MATFFFCKLFCRLVRYAEEIAATAVITQHSHYIFEAERMRAAAAKDCNLITAFVGGTVAVEAF